MEMQKNVSEERSYESMEDDELVLLAREQGDERAFETLYKKYSYIVGYKAKKYYAPGSDHEDLKQEGNVGLINSIKDYKIEHPTSFKVFCELCIHRQIITAIKAATRQKHLPLNQSISIDKPMYEDESDRSMHDTIENKRQFTPEDIVIDRENVIEILAKLKDRLSPFEAQVFEGQLQRLSYQEIADGLGKHVKSIDNAMQRIRDKVEKILAEINSELEGF